MMNLSYNDMVTKALAIIKRLVATEPWGCIYLLGWACLDYPLVQASMATWCSHRHGRGSIPDFLVD